MPGVPIAEAEINNKETRGFFTNGRHIINICEIYQIRMTLDQGDAMKTYSGSRTIDGIKVTVDGQPLDERYDIQRFTQSGFEWTYLGNEPRQLALAILADHLGDTTKALELSEAFMNASIADLDNDWSLSSDDINRILADMGSG